MKQGWQLIATQDGDPIYRKTDQFQLAKIPLFPLRTLVRFNLPELSNANGQLLIPEGDSVATFTADAGLIASTNPPSDAKPVPEGELRSVQLRPYATGIEIEAASPFGRTEAVRKLLDIPVENWLGFVLVGLIGIVVAALKDKIKDKIKSGPSKTPKPEPAAD